MAQAVFTGAPVAVGTWVLDAAASRFEFQVKSFWGLMMVRGVFRWAEGRAEVHASGSISASVRIDAASVDSKQKQRDKHLRSADFFHVEQHPTVTFATTTVDVLAADRLLVEGDLTVAGHTMRIAFESRVAQSNDAVTVEAQVAVDRTRFGMTHNPLHMVSPTALLAVRAQFGRISPA
jgi:polyisoprenoid-binding protein YceI